ncbi:aldo-keto reductase family 1 member B1-like [Bacillus rossius redtenbacheri]|uniref:aldo-keto reductase family 1 member B1-like n=1 Tax=Bacillus rossius redtenbacheri TaxID=93214 RepID=UPI002FDEB593
MAIAHARTMGLTFFMWASRCRPAHSLLGSWQAFKLVRAVHIMAAPTVTLNNGKKIPQLGFGTWQSKPGEVEQAVKDAIDAGYRHIDGAHVYGNEKEVGAGIRAKISEGVVKREDLFVTSKLWNTYHRPGAVLPALKKTLSDLGLDYLDLYLIHWPFALKEGSDLFPQEGGKAAIVDLDYVDTWKAMEKLVEAGLARSIGISNFNSEQVKRVVAAATIKPVTNQVECHPYLNQKKLRELCKQHGIIITAYSPLGNPGSSYLPPGTPNILKDAKLVELAKKHGKSVAQVILRYLIQIGTVPIPKSVTKSRIQENIKVFDFELAPEDIAYVDSLDRGVRTCPYADAVGFPNYPFSIDY